MIHQYKLNGYNIVLDISSGAVHAVDDLANDVIERFETQSADQILSELVSKYAENSTPDPEFSELCRKDPVAAAEEIASIYNEVQCLKD